MNDISILLAFSAGWTPCIGPILSVKPVENHPPKPQFMHGFILGGFYQISTNMQIELEEALNI